MDAIPESERASNTNSLDLPAVNVERILGIQWNVKNDKFQFSITDIPRCYIPTGFGDTLRFELHHFSMQVVQGTDNAHTYES